MSLLQKERFTFKCFYCKKFSNLKKKYYPYLFDIIHGGKMVGRRRVKLSERFIGRTEFTVKMLPVVINRGAIRRRETLQLTWTGADATHNPYDIVVQVNKGELKDKTQGPQTCSFHLAFKIHVLSNSFVFNISLTFIWECITHDLNSTVDSDHLIDFLF